jgi:hypothetical protein
MSASAAWEITEFRGPSGLAQLEADWRRLYLELPGRTCFHSFEAFKAYAAHRMERPDLLRCFRLSDGTRTRAICALEPRLERRLGPPVRIWGVLAFHDHLAEFPCADAEARRALAPALLAHLRRSREGRALLALGPEPPDSALWDPVLDRGGRCVEAVGTMCSMDCSMPYEKLLAGVRRHFRRDLALARNRLAPLAGVRYAVAREPAELEAAWRTYLEVEAAGWKGRARTALLHRRGQSGFYADLIGSLRSGTDFCEIITLHAEERCLAALLGVRTGSTYSAIKICYDEAYGRVSPGQLVLAKAVERCCADPEVQRLDLVSDAYWLRGWRLDSVPLQRAFVDLGGCRGRMLAALLRLRLGPLRRLARWAQDQASRWRQSRRAAKPAAPPRTNQANQASRASQASQAPPVEEEA